MNSAFLRVRSAIAIAQIIGLYRDPRTYNAKPLQAERARRLWWKLYESDRGLSLLVGRPYTIIDRFVDVDMPIPYDDNDISEGPDGELLIDKSRTGKAVMYYRLYTYFFIRNKLRLVLELLKTLSLT
jgi:Fungal specific transcription factor domain